MSDKTVSTRTSRSTVSPTLGPSAGALPSFLLIGAMRSGSTSLARYLGAHPQIYIAPQKEVHFFDWYFDRGLDWYRGQFDGANGAASVGEATPVYMVYRAVMERVHATVPDARLIAILRNPVERAYSHYWFNRMLGIESLEFADALDAEQARRTDTIERRTFDYVERGRYVRQLEMVTELFARDALHVVLFEDLEREPAPTYAAVCRFLGVDDGVVPDVVGTALNRYSVYRSGVLQRIAVRLPAGLRRASRRFNRREASYPPMDATVQARLEQTFAEDNAKLAVWLGRDLSAWAPEGV